MNTIRELKQQEKYKSMLKRKNKEKKIYKDKNASLQLEKQRLYIALRNKDKEIERLKKDNEYLNKKHEKTIHNIMEFVDKNTFNHRNTGERILTLHGKGILDLLDICLGVDEE